MKTRFSGARAATLLVAGMLACTLILTTSTDVSAAPPHHGQHGGHQGWQQGWHHGGHQGWQQGWHHGGHQGWHHGGQHGWHFGKK